MFSCQTNISAVSYFFVYFFRFLFIFCFVIKQSAAFAKKIRCFWCPWLFFCSIQSIFFEFPSLFSRLFFSIFQSVFFQICLFHSSFSLGRILVSNSLLHNFLLINRVKDVWEVSLCAMEINSWSTEPSAKLALCFQKLIAECLHNETHNIFCAL